jgi:Ni/Co efflux regulator RcnB
MNRRALLAICALATALTAATQGAARPGRAHGHGGARGRAGGPAIAPRPSPGPAGAWDPARHNGFWRAGRWNYGPPPPGYGPAEIMPGHAPWRRGAYLPPYYHAAVIEDYDRYRLRRPPYGYHWVYAGGDYMLVSGSTGLIFDVIPGR